jgi:hypothetical protein
MLMNKNSKGIAHLFLVIAVVIVGIGAIGYFALKNGQIQLEQTNLSPTPAASTPNSPSVFEIPSSAASITITLDALNSPAEVLITNPQGQRTGKDPQIDTVYNEIPNAFYYVESLASDTGEGGSGHPYKIFDLTSPPDGSYTVQVIGTGSGSYILDILNYDKIGNPASKEISGQTEVGSVNTYRMDYSSSPGAQVNVITIQQ